MAWNMERSDRKNIGWSSSMHFPLQSPSQGHHSGYGMSLFLAEVDSLNSSWCKSSSASYDPVSIRVPHWVPTVRHSDVDLPLPRYIGSYQIPTGPG